MSRVRALAPVPLARIALVLAALPACRGPDGSALAGPRAECPVCVHEGDLACVDVTVEPDTPRCECDGRTYYFCSEECRADFEARPERYSPSVPAR